MGIQPFSAKGIIGVGDCCYMASWYIAFLLPHICKQDENDFGRVYKFDAITLNFVI